MTAPQAAAGSTSRSGVRRFGDHYQDLIAWCAALRVVQPGAQFTQLEVEATGAGNVDDVVLRTATGPHRYTQVKWTTNTAELITTEYLTSSPARGSSLLQKLYRSWQTLSAGPGTAPYLELVTNRNLDRSDPLLGHCDGRTDLLVPAARLAAHDSAAGRRLTEWVAHVQADRDALLDMLGHLRFRTGLTMSGELDRAQALMSAAGLRGDDAAIDAGLRAVGSWIRGGRRVLTRDDLTAEIDRLGIHADDPRAILLLQAIDRDPHPDDATIALDWVDLYDGDTAPTRRQPRDPADWSTMNAQLQEAAAQLAEAGHRDVLLRGKMRQATFFTVGARLAQVTGTTVSYLQHRDLWASDARRAPVAPLSVRRSPIGRGHELAVAIGITVDPTDAVLRWIAASGLPVRELITLLPGDGPHDQAVNGPGEAVAYAQLLRNHVRAELEAEPSSHVHLFLAGPGGLALLAGHRWNRVARTTVYEDLGAGHGYTPAFNIDA